MRIDDSTLWLRDLGSTGLTVSAVAAGGAGIGSWPEFFGYDVPIEQALQLVSDILDSPVRVIDTSNGYSEGESERRIGQAIALRGGLPDDHWVATKVDSKDGDYSARRVRDSIRESQDRLGLEFFPLVYLHDPEYAPDISELLSPGGAVEALIQLRDEGVIHHLGVAGGDVGVMQRFVATGAFEVLLTHNRWTLVDRSAGTLIDEAVGRGMGVVNAAYLGGGLLANPHGTTRYGYRPASNATVAAARALEQLSATWNVPLATAALQFSLRDPRIDMSIVGISKPERLPALVSAVETELPPDFWVAAEKLLPSEEHWLG
ncbi:aldo/keto reductase [Microbacterium deminutum]|uniref:Aldo/keto reductase n=1 Tax=Microbacterium deminutum TaxID=344164 RepID=A0ABP5CXT1_9MICO